MSSPSRTDIDVVSSFTTLYPRKGSEENDYQGKTVHYKSHLTFPMITYSKFLSL